MLTQHLHITQEAFCQHIKGVFTVHVTVTKQPAENYLPIPESQLSLNKEVAAVSSSWSASCLKRLPGRKLSSLPAVKDWGAWRRKDKQVMGHLKTSTWQKSCSETGAWLRSDLQQSQRTAAIRKLLTFYHEATLWMRRTEESPALELFLAMNDSNAGNVKDNIDIIFNIDNQIFVWFWSYRVHEIFRNLDLCLWPLPLTLKSSSLRLLLHAPMVLTLWSPP